MERSKDVPKVSFSDWIMGYGTLMQCLIILGWIHRYKNASVVITNWLTEISILQMTMVNRSFTFCIDVVFHLSLPRLLLDLTTVYMSNTVGALSEADKLLIFLGFCVVLLCVFMLWVPVWFMVFNVTFNFSAIWRRSALLEEETRVPEENHRPVISHLQTLSHYVVSITPHHERDSNSYLLLQ